MAVLLTVVTFIVEVGLLKVVILLVATVFGGVKIFLVIFVEAVVDNGTGLEVDDDDDVIVIRDVDVAPANVEVFGAPRVLNVECLVADGVGLAEKKQIIQNYLDMT